MPENAYTTTEVLHVPLGELVPTKLNPRKHRNPLDDERLADSIKAHGVLHPGLARKTDKGIELLIGRRRFDACKAAGTKCMPVTLIEADDAKALEIIIIENMQRADVTPFEQAKALDQLVKLGKTLPDAAKAIGLAAQDAARRLSLLRLCKEWRDALDDEKMFLSLLRPEHLERVARLPASTQLDVLKELTGFHGLNDLGRVGFTPDGINAIVKRILADIRTFPWKEDDETLDPKAGPCNKCTKRSNAEPELFEDLASAKNGGQCLDRACFNGKLQRLIQLKVDDGAAPLMLTHEHASREVANKFDPDYTAVHKHNFTPLKKNHKDAKPFVRIDDKGAGQVVYGKIAKQDSFGRVNGKTSKPEKNKEPTPAERLKASETRLEERRAGCIINGVTEAIAKVEKDPAAQLKRIGDAKTAMCLAAAFGTTYRHDYAGAGRPGVGQANSFQHFKDFNRNPSKAAELLIKSTAEIIRKRLGFHDLNAAKNNMPEARQACELLGIDFAAITKKAEEEIPVPKALTKLRTEAKEAKTRKLPKNKVPKKKPAKKEKAA